jgi:hypothetical protein
MPMLYVVRLLGENLADMDARPKSFLTLPDARAFARQRVGVVADRAQIVGPTDLDVPAASNAALLGELRLLETIS